MRKIGMYNPNGTVIRVKQSRFRLVIWNPDARLDCGPRVLECDMRELRRKRFSRGRMRRRYPLRGSSRFVSEFERCFNYTGCRRMKVPF